MPDVAAGRVRVHSPAIVDGDLTASFHTRTELSEAEMTRIDELETGQRLNVDPDAAIEANMQMRVPS